MGFVLAGLRERRVRQSPPKLLSAPPPCHICSSLDEKRDHHRFPLFMTLTRTILISLPLAALIVQHLRVVGTVPRVRCKPL